MNNLQKTPRIVSLCPSVTQTIIDLGAEQMLAGITDFCPETVSKYNTPLRIGGPKNPNFELIDKINPDIVIFIEEENSLNDFQKLSKYYNSISYKIETIESSLELISALGSTCNKDKKAEELIRLINNEIGNIPKQNSNYFYFVWKNPWIIAGKNTYINSFLNLFDFHNKAFDSSYPRVDLFELNKFPDTVFLPDEPFHFNTNNSGEIQNYFKETNFIFLDGRICSWFGSFTLKAIRDFKHLLKVS